MKRILLAIAAFLLTYGASKAQCTPAFTYAASPTLNNLLNVSFNNSSVISPLPTGSITSYKLYFGDGGNVNLSGSTSHNYAAPGTYNVKLVSTKTDTSNAILCKDSVTIAVTVGYSPCATTMSRVVSTTTPGLITFTANTPAGSAGVTYTWSFGDGTSGTGSPISHTFVNPGYYCNTVTATVAGTTCSYSNTICDTITTPCSNHTATVSSSVNFATVSFSQNAPNFAGQTKVYNWNFGDGTTGTGSYPAHTYSTSGAHTVTLTVNWVDANNNIICTYTATHIVTTFASTVCAGHTASFSQSPFGSTLFFTNTSTSFAGQSTSSSWIFGDGAVSNITHPFHTYIIPGTYNVTLITVWTSTTSPTFQCVDTAYQTVTIPPSATNVISGNIYKDTSTGQYSDTFKVWLITYNSTTSTLAAVDSVLTYGYSYNTTYSFNSKPAGTYLTKAAKIGGTVGSFGIIPTYHDSSAYWSAATNIVHTGGLSVNKDIWMKNGTVTSGPGFIGGNVNAGANKVTGAAIPNLLVMLRDANNKVIQMAYTNAQGDFSFSNIPVGTYSVYPEELNYITTPFNGIVLTASNPSKTGVVFGQTNTELKPKTTGIEVLSATDAASLYPNPSTGMVNISWKNITGNVSVSVADIAGHSVYSLPNANTASLAKLDLSQLQNGIYLIHITTANGVQTQKLTIMK